MSYLFVYGTLRRKFDLKLKDQICKHLQYICKAKVRAAMYDLGAYPGAVKTGNDSEIIGEVFLISEPEELLKYLDEYEGEEYVRKKTRIRLNNGKMANAWMYWYCGPVEGKDRIRYKDYFNYLKNKKPAFINGAL